MYLLEIVALEPRVVLSAVALLEIVGVLDGTRQKAAAQGTVRDDPDPELPAHGNQLLLQSTCRLSDTVAGRHLQEAVP